MAWVKVMLSTKSQSGWMQRCILMTRSDRSEAWIEAIARAAEQQGLALAVTTPEVPVQPLDGADQRIIIAFDPALLDPAPDAACASIIESDGFWGRDQEGAEGREAVALTSMAVAIALLWPAALCVWPAMTRSAEVLELLPGLWVVPPRNLERPQTDFTAAVDEALALYDGGLPSVGACGVWRPELFTFEPSLKLGDNGLGDITGPPRPLIKGPYFRLPPGLWEVTATFSVDPDACRHCFRFEWGPAGDFSSARVVPSVAGRYEIALTREWIDVAPAELIVELLEGSLGGGLGFEGARVRKLA